MFSSLDKFLIELSREGEIWYCPNPGNAGDALIAAATWQRFRMLGIKAHPIPRDGFDATGRIVLFGGGGNLVPLYTQASDFLAAHNKKAKHVVLLPHTVDGHETLLGSLGANATLFCREEVSFAHCRRNAPHANVLLSHDLAIGLDPSKLPPPGIANLSTLISRGAWATLRRGRVDGPGLAEIRRVLAFSRRHGIFEFDSKRKRSSEILNAFRNDAESAGRPLPTGNVDLSTALELRSYLERPLSVSASLLLGSLRGYKTVRTDRLHVCIAAALQGIDVEFHANSYFKCKAIWMHSLREWFPSIHWMD